MDEKMIEQLRKLAFDMADKLHEEGLTGFELSCGEVKIKVRKDLPVQVSAPAAVAAAPAASPAAAPAQPAAQESAPAQQEMRGNVVKSPIVGTFYAAAAPGADPFVSIGSTVKKGDVLCIVEAMKMLNEIESEYDGVVKSILVENGDLIEYDQPIMVIE